MKVKVGETEYKIRIRAAAYYYLQMISVSIANPPTNPEEISKAEEEVFKLCVEPEPKEEDKDILLAHILQRYGEILRTLSESFRPTIPPSPRQSGPEV